MNQGRIGILKAVGEGAEVSAIGCGWSEHFESAWLLMLGSHPASCLMRLLITTHCCLLL